LEVWQAVVLGIVQGLTEFLPISSSGHLVLAPRVFGWEEGGLTFDVGLHLGTTLAVLVYFWRDWLALVEAGRAIVLRRPAGKNRLYRRMLPLIILGSIPAAVVGLALNDFIEEHLRSTALITAMIGIFALVMLAAERLGPKLRGLDRLRITDASAVGAAQAISLIPGVSRSGVTISAGLFTGLTRAAAARFSFLLGTPAILGAALLQGIDLARGEEDLDLAIMLAGFVASACVGFATIHFLMRFLATNGLEPFVIYRIVLCLVLTAWMLA
jgi:undecaprenyl-diphosphatase